MRFVLFAALAVLSLGLFGASGARAEWTCMGAEYVCGGSASPKKAMKAYSKKASYSKKATKVASYQKRKAVASYQKKKPAQSSASYGGGSTGIASYYWQGQMTASGVRFNPNAMTAAHRTLPFGTRVRVTNQSNGKTVTVTINDRGPFIKGRIIDLSSAAAGVIGMKGAGLARVSVSVLGKS